MADIIDALVVTLNLDAADFKKGVEVATTAQKKLADEATAGQKKAADEQKKTRDDAKKTADELHERGKVAADFFKQITEAAISMFAVFTAGKSVKDFIRDVSGTNAALGRLAPNLGLSVEQLSKWQNALALTGANGQEANSAMQGIASAMFDMSVNRNTSGAAAFSMLGLTPQDLKDTDAAILKISAGLAKMTPIQRQGWASMIPGMTPEMANLLGNPDLMRLLKEGGKTAVTTEQAKASQEITHAWVATQQAIAACQNMLIADFEPIVIRILNVVKSIAEYLREHNRLLEGLFLVAGGAAAAFTARTALLITGLIARFAALGAAATAAGTAAGAALGAGAAGPAAAAAGGTAAAVGGGIAMFFLRRVLPALGVLVPTTANAAESGDLQEWLRNNPGSGGTPSPFYQLPPGASNDGESFAPGQDLIEAIKQKEGFSANAYWDSKQYSIGYGTKANSTVETIDRTEAERRLREEVGSSSATVDSLARQFGLNLNQNQRDALTDFAYNVGGGALRNVMSRANGNLSAIPQILTEYNHADGQVNNGLTARRAWEGQLFMSPAGRVGPQSNAGSTSSTHIGAINIYTQAADAHGIARDLRRELGRYGYVAHANAGLV